MSKIRNSRFYIKLPFFLALALVCGIFIGAVFFNTGRQNDITTGYRKFAEVLNFIQKDYVDTVNINGLVDVSITRMLEELDPHTVYIPKTGIELAHSQLEGDFEGIGVEFNIIRDTIIVVAPISGGPSEQVGIQAGDKIVKVNDSVVAGAPISNADVFRLLRGKKGTTVKLSIKRGNDSKLLVFNVTRNKIPTYSIDVAYLLDPETGYIKVSRFSASTYEEFKRALEGLKQKGMKRLVLDLRDNPGGYMDRATKIADEFLSGNKLIVYTDGKEKRYDQKIYASRKGDFEEGALVVLINEGSASASEIVTGALQDNDRALVVGRRSFGKGLVQMPIPLHDNSELRLTISRYYTPSGRSIQKPYDGGSIDDYNSDLLKRYEHGEFFHSDSIKFNDSLKYKTLHGRTVYGGGGIMPDIFVPRDTSAFTNYLLDLFNKNIIREYSLDYYAAHRDDLEKMSFEEFLNNFSVTDKMLKDVIANASRRGVKFREKEFRQSEPFIRQNLKAYIARSLWGNEGFYPIINQNDDVIRQAIKHFNKAHKLAME